MLPAEHFVFALYQLGLSNNFITRSCVVLFLSFFTFQTNQRAALCEALRLTVVAFFREFY